MTTPLAVTPRTVIDGCFDASGTAELATVYDVGLALDLPEQTVRLTIRRMQAAGELEQQGRGRAGRLVRSPRGTARSRLDSRLVDFAFTQDAGGHPWDGNWRLYAFSIPESARAERDRLRGALTALGAAASAPGLYVSPHDLATELDATLDGGAARWLIRATSADLVLPGAESAAAIAELLWPESITLEAYEPLASVLAALPDAPARSEPADPVLVTAQALRLAEGLDRALTVDPLLPAELRAVEWRPRELRSAFLTAWETLRSASPELPVFQDA